MRVSHFCWLIKNQRTRSESQESGIPISQVKNTLNNVRMVNYKNKHTHRPMTKSVS